MLVALLGGDCIACGGTVTTASSLYCRHSLLERVMIGAIYSTASWTETSAILLDAVEAKQADLIPAQGIRTKLVSRPGILSYDSIYAGDATRNV